MKSFTAFFMLCFFATTAMMAQPSNRAQKEERIRALRVAFITDKLQLTPKESEKFWPIYNEYEKEKKKLRDKIRNQRPRNPDLTDKEAEELMLASLNAQEQQLALKRKYYSQLKQAIPVKKLAKLDRAEREFRETVVKEMKRRKQRNSQRNNK